MKDACLSRVFEGSLAPLTCTNRKLKLENYFFKPKAEFLTACFFDMKQLCQTSYSHGTVLKVIDKDIPMGSKFNRNYFECFKMELETHNKEGTATWLRENAVQITY